MNVEHKISEERKPESFEEILQKTFNEGVKTGVRFALEKMQQLQADVNLVTEGKNE